MGNEVSSGRATWRRVVRGGLVLGAAALAAGFVVQAVSAASSPTSWGSVEAPLPANATGASGNLDLPVCPAVRVCWALGSYFASVSPTSDTSAMLIEHLSKGDWTPTEAPLPPNTPAGSTTAGGLACPSVGWCVAVGTYAGLASGALDSGLIDTYSNGTWTSTFAPAVPPGQGVTDDVWLSGVACPRVGSCVAIGDVGTGGSQTAFVDILSQGKWQALATPGPGSSEASLSQVACPAASRCDVIGSYPVGQTRHPFAGTLNGSTWAPAALPLPTNAAPASPAAVTALSCPATGTCVAVGEYDLTGGYAPLVETLAGGTWTPLEAPAPAGSTAAQLAGVDCVSASTCTAIGDYRTANGLEFGMVDSLAGGTWTSVAAPVPGNAGPNTTSALQAVSCVPPDACVAVGSVAGLMTGLSAISNVQGLLETGSSATWSASAAPEPSPGPGGRDNAYLQGVACPSNTYCVAVGRYIPSAGDTYAGEIVITPRISLSPASPAPGATVTATLSGFDADQSVVLTWRSVTGKVLANTVTDASGAAVVTFVVPKVAAGQFRVLATGAGGPSAAVTLTVS